MTGPDRQRLIPPGATERYVTVPAGRLKVLQGGDARPDRPPLVLVHGGGSDNAAISWYRLFAPLTCDHEVWAIDLPGFGGSVEAPPVGGPKAMAATLASVLDELEIGKAVVFGVSMGGDVALNLALDHPGHVAGLVLIAPGGLAPTLGSPIKQRGAWLMAQVPDWLLLPMARLANRFVRTALRAMVKDPATIPPEVIEEFAREARHPLGGIAYGRYNQATLGRTEMLNDLSGRVGEITVPTLFFHGQDDPLVDPQGSCRAAKVMPNARTHLVPDCGHWAQLEAHEIFLETVEIFLGEHL